MMIMMMLHCYGMQLIWLFLIQPLQIQENPLVQSYEYRSVLLSLN